MDKYAKAINTISTFSDPRASIISELKRLDEAHTKWGADRELRFQILSLQRRLTIYNLEVRLEGNHETWKLESPAWFLSLIADIPRCLHKEWAKINNIEDPP